MPTVKENPKRRMVMLNIFTAGLFGYAVGNLVDIHTAQQNEQRRQEWANMTVEEKNAKIKKMNANKKNSDEVLKILAIICGVMFGIPSVLFAVGAMIFGVTQAIIR